jgi:hypothetical protein
MQKRLTETKRAALEARFKKLKQVRAYFDAGKASNIVDKVSPEDAHIQGVVEALMRVMEADPVTSYTVNKSASKTKLAKLVRKALANEEGESPMTEAKDLENPILHPVEDLEHEVQTMDDAHLTHEVEQLEEDLKNKMFNEGDSDESDTASAPQEVASKEPPSLNPEQKMALLMSLPKSKRLEKAANLRALADALEMKEHEVSQNNDMHGNPNDALAHDYETEEAGSMKDTGTKVANLKNALRQLIAASEEVEKEKENEEEEKEDEKPEEAEEMDKQAVLKLALRHLLASVEDMEEQAAEKADDDDEDEKEDEAEKEDEEKEDEADEKHEASQAEKRAILRAHLATLRQQKIANVDGKTMSTPKEVPSPSGTTEDQLKGDAKIQYAPALGETGTDAIQERRQKIPTDKPVAGTDEPNELYFSNKSVPGDEKLTSEKDSSKDVNNKRILKDEQPAVFVNHEIVPGAGTHQKAKDWETAKSESDVTPGGERLKGLAELIQYRTDRAMKLAAKMADAGQIKTQAQLQEQVVRLASLDDDVFAKVAEVFNGTVQLSKKAEMPENFKAHEGDPDDKKPPFAKKEDESEEDDKEEDEDEKPAFFDKKEAARALRRKASPEEDSYGTSIRTASRGVNKPLLMGGNVPTAQGSEIAGKLTKLAWSDAVTKAEEQANLDTFFKGNTNPGLV